MPKIPFLEIFKIMRKSYFSWIVIFELRIIRFGYSVFADKIKDFPGSIAKFLEGLGPFGPLNFDSRI